MTDKYYFDDSYFKNEINLVSYIKARRDGKDCVFEEKREGKSRFYIFEKEKKYYPEPETACTYCLNKCKGRCEYIKTYKKKKMVLIQYMKDIMVTATTFNDFLYYEWDDSQDNLRLREFYKCIRKVFKYDTLIRDWYLNFYKDVPNYFYIEKYKDVKKAYPYAKNWKDIENYM